MLPERWPLVVCRDTREQFDVVASLLASSASRRGRLRDRRGARGRADLPLHLREAGCTQAGAPAVDLVAHARRHPPGLRAPPPGAELDPLADAARGRSRADWLVGMNLSRAYTLAHGETPARGPRADPHAGHAGRARAGDPRFVPEDYLEVVATFDARRTRCTLPRYVVPAAVSRPGTRRRLPEGGDGGGADRAPGRRPAGPPSSRSTRRRGGCRRRCSTTSPSCSATRTASTASARKETLEAAQALYERRSSSATRAPTAATSRPTWRPRCPRSWRPIAAPYADLLAPGTGERPLGPPLRRRRQGHRPPRHHPDDGSTRPASRCRTAERRIYDLVCRRLLMAWHDDHVFSVTTVITRVTGPEADPRWTATTAAGTAVQAAGWKVLELAAGKNPARSAERPGGGRRGAGPASRRSRPELAVDGRRGQRRWPKRTRPPRRFTDATLLTAMETAARARRPRARRGDEGERAWAPPATRAEIIETLLRREYVVRQGRSLAATDKGIRLIEMVHPDVKSPR